MRDKKDNTTCELPGFGQATLMAPDSKRPFTKRIRKPTAKQVQLELLAPTDTSGLPMWLRDPNTDLSGLPIWAPD